MDYPLDFLEYLYRGMLRIRLAEEGLVEPILNGEVHTPCHLYSGQEAIAMGLCAALTQEDYLFGGHRSHGHYLAKGGSLKAMMAEIYCKETGCSRGRGGSMHLIEPDVGMMGSAPIVGGTISLAVGAALASSIRKHGRVSVSFFGDGATGEGVLYESLNFSALKKLPIIFVCENNFYATHMPIADCRPSCNITEIAASFGIQNITVDGNDVLSVYEAACQAADICRKGNGPFFIEALTYRIRGHVGPDDNIQGDHSDIRPKEEIAIWHKRDPIKRFEEYLIAHGIFSADSMNAIREDVFTEVSDAISYAVKSPSPRRADLSKNVFA